MEKKRFETLKRLQRLNRAMLKDFNGDAGLYVKDMITKMNNGTYKSPDFDLTKDDVIDETNNSKGNICEKKTEDT